MKEQCKLIILIELILFSFMEDRRTRGCEVTLVKEQCKLIILIELILFSFMEDRRTRGCEVSNVGEGTV